MAYDHYQAILTSPVTGVTNPAIVDFSVLDPGASTKEEDAAGIIAYINAVGRAGVLGPNVAISGLNRRNSGASGGLPVAFPVTEYAALVAANAGFITAMTDYGVVGNGTAFAAIGDSVTVSLYTAVPGRHTTGRHYLPWISTDVNDGNGHLVGTAAPQIQDAYRAFLMGTSSGLYTGVVNTNPVVHSTVAGDHLVTVPKVSLNFSRLKTRTR